MKAMVVDDSRSIRRIVGDILREAGFEVADAANGRLALSLLESGFKPDVALIDWNMPEMNGIELVKEIRSRSEYDDVPLMMVTTETEMERMAAAFVAGANEYLMKPFDREAMLEKLQILGVGI
jgi:two-component system chemotaxis response regulator CheY